MTHSISRWLLCASVALVAAGMSVQPGTAQSLDGYWLSDEGGGVPPDIPIAVFPKDDLAAGRDSALEKAIEVLSTPAAGRP